MNRGRGRARRSAGPRPVARDEQGQVVEVKQEGPPPLYPEIDLPPVPVDELKTAELWTKSFNLQGSAWKKSFKLDLRPPDKPGKHAAPALAMIALEKEARVIPEELVSQDKKRKSESLYWESRKQGRAADKDLEDLDLTAFDELARRESLARAGGRPSLGGGGIGELAEDAEQEIEDEREELDREQREIEQDEEDDYDAAYDDAYEGYDDDEGYEDDDYGGGGDEGPFF